MNLGSKIVTAAVLTLAPYLAAGAAPMGAARTDSIPAAQNVAWRGGPHGEWFPDRGAWGGGLSFAFAPFSYDYAYDPGYAYSSPGYYDYGYASPGYYDYGYASPGYPAPGGDAAYCAQRYRSYDPASGTYLGYDGIRHPCP